MYTDFRGGRYEVVRTDLSPGSRRREVDKRTVSLGRCRVETQVRGLVLPKGGGLFFFF